MKIDIRSTYEKLFWEESRDQIKSMENALLRIENSDFKVLDLIFEDLQIFYRMTHSIKGTTATMGFLDIRDLAHEIENIISAVISGQLGLTFDLIALLFDSIDLLATMHQQLLETDPIDLTDNIQSLSIKMKSFSFHPQTKGVCEPIKWDKETDLTYQTYIEILFEKETDMKSVKSYLIIDALSSLGEISKVIPEDYELLEDETFGQTLYIWMADRFSKLEIKNALEPISELEKITIDNEKNCETQALLKSPIEAIKDSMKVNTNVNPETYFKISDNRLDLIMALIEEQVVVKEALGYSLKLLGTDYPNDKRIQKLYEHYESLVEINNGLRSHFLEVRMVPIGPILQQFSRMVRELAKECNKKVDLYISGGEIEIDRNLLEKIVDPLTHILRNAVDHGLEIESKRIALGKPIKGSIKLKVYHDAGKIIIIIEDDGSGIQKEKVILKALENGLIEKDEVNQTDVESLIFMHGVSTAQTVSKISGRGVGLEIVKHNIETLNGRIKLISEANIGTQFIIELPQNMTIFKALLIRANEFIFAIPFHWIIEVMRGSTKEVLTTVFCNDMAYPILKLSHILELNEMDKKTCYLILLQVKDKQFALQVEAVIGEQEIVFKSLQEYIGEHNLLGSSPVINGVTFLGNGDLAYVLDPNTIFSGVINEGINS